MSYEVTRSKHFSIQSETSGLRIEVRDRSDGVELDIYKPVYVDGVPRDSVKATLLLSREEWDLLKREIAEF
jgi:hypothetical protein